MCIVFVCVYYMSVLSMSVMGFQKKVCIGLCGWIELYPLFFKNFLTINYFFYRYLSSTVLHFIPKYVALIFFTIIYRHNNRFPDSGMDSKLLIDLR